jgi:uncharacterized protein YndB with AHSA1/START domain
MAIRIEHSVVINRPVAEVFAYGSDPKNQTEWQGGLVRVEADSPIAEGAVSTEVRKVMGREMETVMKCVEFDPPHKFQTKSQSGPVEMTFTMTCKPLGDNTQVDVLVEGEPGGFFGVAAPLLKRQVQKDIEKDYANLKEILEG